MSRTAGFRPRADRLVARGAVVAIALGLVVWGLLACGPTAPAQEAVPGGAANGGAANKERFGRLIKIAAPITDRVDQTVRRNVEAALEEAKRTERTPILVFQLAPGRTDFGQAYDLAQYLSSDALNGATTVAFVPESISGHTVLVALACQEIVMAPLAEIGPAGENDRVIEPTRRTAYAEVANRRRTVPADVALALLDPAVELRRIETPEAVEFVAGERLADAKFRGAPSRVLKTAGQPGRFTGVEFNQFGFASTLAEDTVALGRALGVAASDLSAEMLERPRRAVRVSLSGPITPRTIQTVGNTIAAQVTGKGVDKADLICLWIDSPGGSPAEAISLANRVAELPKSVRTVAYVPREARADAAFIALACDEIVLEPGAILGGQGAGQIEEADLEATRQALGFVVGSKGRSPGLAAAMIDPSVEVFVYTRNLDGLREHLTADEVAALPDADQWVRGARITTPGEPLKIDAEMAEELGLAIVVENFEDFKVRRGIDDGSFVQPGWADELIRRLNTPGLAWTLLLIGVVALWVEMQSPGIGAGALVAAVAFLLFFWLQFLGGTAGWLEVILFVAGLTFLLIEFFVLPGLGLFGIAGGVLVIASVLLASQTFIIPRNDYQLEILRNRLLGLAGVTVASGVAIALLQRVLPHTPGFNRMMLRPPAGEELNEIERREALARLDHLLGEEGSAVTRLSPAGKVRFGDELVDVVADGEFVDPGRMVRVVEVRGSRVVVRTV